MLVRMFIMGPPSWSLTGNVEQLVTVAGRRIRVLAEASPGAQRRRLATGPCPGALERSHLAALATLPEGIRIPWREVDLETQLELDVLAEGAIQTDAIGVTRLWRPPVDVKAVCAVDGSPTTALRRLSVFASVAPRVLQLSSEPRDRSTFYARAERLGIGVFVGTAAFPVTGAPTAHHVLDDARRWEVAEAVYAAANGGRARARPMSEVAAG